MRIAAALATPEDAPPVLPSHTHQQTVGTELCVPAQLVMHMEGATQELLKPSSVVLELGNAAGVERTGDGIYYRRLQPGDMEQCMALHRLLFPIDYEDTFYSSALNEENGIITLAAMQLHSGNGSDGGETLVGVVTAKLVCEVEAEDVDVGRWLLRDGHSGGGVRRFCGANSSIPPASLADMSTSVPPWTPYVYILTLGTLESHRRLGIASKLLERVRRVHQVSLL